MTDFQAFIQSLNFWQWVGFILLACVFRSLKLWSVTTTNKTATGGGATVK